MAKSMQDILRENMGGSKETSSGNSMKDILQKNTGGGSWPSVTDPNTVEGLQQLVQQANLAKEAKLIEEDSNKLNFLQRGLKILGAFNPADAIVTSDDITRRGGTGGQAVAGAAKQYVKGLASDVWAGITGDDNDFERKTFKDVVKRAGVKSAVAQYGVGFLGDVFLDPSTYFGGALVKGLLKGGSKLVKGGVGLADVIAPGTKGLAEGAFEGVSEALGKAFVPGYKTQEGYVQRITGVLSKLDDTKQEILLNNFRIMGTDTLTKAQQIELTAKLIAGKKAEYIARTEGKTIAEAAKIGQAVAFSKDAKIQNAIKTRLAMSQELSQQAGLKDPFAVYFPFIKKDKIKNIFGPMKKIKVGSENYLKQFKNILRDDELILDPVEAFSRRDWEVMKDIKVREDLKNVIDEFGVPTDKFKTVEEAMDAGYVPIYEKGSGFRMKPGVEPKNALGFLPEREAKFLDDMINPEFTTIDMLAKATGFDTLTSLFKRSVTGLFPAFHARNFLSGHIQNFEVLGVDALKPGMIAAGQKAAYKIATGAKFTDDIVKLGGKTMTEKEVLQPFLNHFGTSNGYIKDFDDAIKQFPIVQGKMLSKESIKTTIKTFGLGQDSITMRTARAVGQYIETQQKATAYLTALGQGKTVKEAIGLATKAGFDYRVLTPFESKIMRRIIPFYSFTRKNIELQLRTLKENPQRINQIAKLFQTSPFTTKSSKEEQLYLPHYMKSGFKLKLKDKNTNDALVNFIGSFGTPIEAFTDLFNGNVVMKVLTQTHPLIKAPLQIGVGKDFFREQDLKDVYNAEEYAEAPQFIKDLIGITPVERTIFKKDGWGNYIPTGTRMTYVADEKKLLIARSLFTSRGFTFYHDIMDEKSTNLVKFLKVFTGTKVYDIDLELQKVLQEKSQKEAMTELLKKYNQIAEYRTNYIPKKPLFANAETEE